MTSFQRALLKTKDIICQCKIEKWSIILIVAYYILTVQFLYSGKYDYFMANSLQMKWVQSLNNSSQMVLPTVHKFVFSVLYSHFIWWFSNLISAILWLKRKLTMSINMINNNTINWACEDVLQFMYSFLTHKIFIVRH